MECRRCSNCCREPGWLIPADWEIIAKRLDITQEELLQRYLVIDYLADKTYGYRYVLAPVKVFQQKPLAKPGQRVPWNYAHLEGKCIFLKDNLCSLHPDKPVECREYQCMEHEDKQIAKDKIVDPNEYAKEVLEGSKREEIIKLWQEIGLERYVDKRFNKEHCLNNLRLEQLLLKEYQKDFPDIDKIIEIESQIE